jgi:hypothetical protein
MTRRPHRSLWSPTIAATTGSAIAVAFGIRHGWHSAVICEVVVLMTAGLLYLRGAEDTDTGAILGFRADERQQTVKLKAMRLAAVTAIYALAVAFVIAVALKVTYWPYAVLYLVTAASYFVGLGVYGQDREGAQAAAAASEDVRAGS